MLRASLVVLFTILTVPLLASAEDAGGGNRGEAIRRYQALLADNSPALAARRDELMFRLAVLYLEEAEAGSAGGGGYGGRGRYEQALELLNQVLARPGSIFREDALYYRAIALQETGRAEPSMTDFRALLREFPSSNHASEVWFRVGNDAVTKNRVAEAQGAYQEVLRRGDPRYRDQSAYMYAWSSFSQHQPAIARPTLLDLLTRLETSGQQQGNLYNESIELLAKVLRSEGSTAPLSGPWMGARPQFAPLVLRRAADLFRETSAFRDAGGSYEQLLREYPELPDVEAVEKLVIECYAKAGDGPHAEEARERLIARLAQTNRQSPDLPVLLKDSAVYLHAQARQTKNAALYTRAIETYQAYGDLVRDGAAHWEMLFFQAEARKEAGDVAGAAETYKAIAESRDPARGEEAAFRRIVLLEELKARGATVDQVLVTYSDYFRVYPGGPHEAELRRRQTGYLFDEKRYADALVAGREAVARTADAAEQQKLMMLLARSAFAAGDFPECAGWATRLLRDPALPPASRKETEEIHAAAILKSAEAQKANPLVAAEQYEALARTYPRHPSAAAALYNAAVAYRDNGNKNRALAIFRQIASDYPNADVSRDSTVAAMDLYREAGDPAGSADLLEKAAARTGGTEGANLLYEAATKAREGKADDKAADLYQKFLKASPYNDLRSATARIFLAKRAAAQASSGEAERLAREAISTVPTGLSGDDAQKAQLVLAEARLILGNVALGRFEALRLTDPSPKALERKQQALEETIRHYREAAGYGFADISLASYYKMGYVQLDFANSVIQAPKPRNLRAEERDRYEDLLRERMKPYREAARDAFRLTLEQGKSAGIENEWTARARGLLGEFAGGGNPSGGSAPAAAVPGGASTAPAVVPAVGTGAAPPNSVDVPPPA